MAVRTASTSRCRHWRLWYSGNAALVPRPADSEYPLTSIVPGIATGGRVSSQTLRNRLDSGRKRDGAAIRHAGNNVADKLAGGKVDLRVTSSGHCSSRAVRPDRILRAPFARDSRSFHVEEIQMKKKAEAEDSVLMDAAKTIGTAAGKIAALLGVDAPPRKPSAPKVPKFQKKNKSRLPRREKKALKKAASLKS